MSHGIASEHGSAPRLTQSCETIAAAFRLAITSQLILLALAGVLIACLGWRVSGAVFLSTAGQPDLANPAPSSEFHEYAARWPGGRGKTEKLPLLLFDWSNRQLAPADHEVGQTITPISVGANRGQHSVIPIDPVLGVAYRMVEPFRQLLNPHTDWRSLGYFLSGGLCSLAVWALVGGAITRTAVVRLGVQQRVGVRESVAFASRQWLAFFSAPAFPLIGIAAIAFPLVVLGWLIRLPYFGVITVGLLWGFVILTGLLMALLAFGLLLGWPLMWGAISAENSDALDAISRSYAYTFQRPFHYLFYAFLAALLGTLGWFLAWGFSEMVITLGYWGLSWGCGSERLAELQMVVNRLGDGQPTTSQWLGVRIIELLVGLVRASASAFSYAYFWCAAAAAYLLLRRDTDQTELDEVATEEHADEFELGLPRLDPEEAGVPGVPPDEVAAVRDDNDS